MDDNKSEETLYAIKVYEKFKMNKDPSKFKNIRKEINIMQNIEHPNIIKLYESVDTLTKISLVVEYGGDSSLLDYLKANFPLSDSLMRRICRQLLSAINYLHEKNIVHRDIKLQNVLMRGHQVKLIDFGFGTLSMSLIIQPIVTANSMPSVGRPITWPPRSLVAKSTLESRPISGPLEWSPTRSGKAATPSRQRPTTSSSGL